MLIRLPPSITVTLTDVSIILFQCRVIAGGNHDTVFKPTTILVVVVLMSGAPGQNRVFDTAGQFAISRDTGS